MAVFTTQLRSICEFLADETESKPLGDVNAIIEKARVKIFDFNYDLYDETYKPVLERKILRHFYMQEIGLETYGLWKFHLENKLNEILPYYNELYKTLLFEYNPIYDIDLTTKRSQQGTQNLDEKHKTQSDISDSSTYSRNQSGSETGDTTEQNNNVSTMNTNRKNNNESENINQFSDTPQNGLSSVKSGRYLTNATVINNTEDNNENASSLGTDNNKRKANTSNITENIINDERSNQHLRDEEHNRDRSILTTDNYVERIFGKQSRQSYSALIREFRENIINIDMMIIDELNELFMGLWR